ncbi:cytochrome-b5 reductase [Malassezia psittaci]|uniref:cytochrome-b5 reductase n=1 Tax=Malassezia psittaci TaxID=1821823 RepID=A0AAF0JE47_9BASI|nr:cytochrome-b5 reductase [Malassezia psittaci]
MFRFSNSLVNATRVTGRSSLMSNARSAVQARQYSTPSKSAQSSNTALYLSLGGAAGLGLWYAMGGLNGDLRSKLSEVRADDGEPALNKDEFRSFKLKEIQPYNHDSAVYVFELPDNKKSGLSVCSCLVVRGAGEDPKDENGKPVIRPYTPINPPDTQGELELLIKHYPEGKMTQYLKTLKVGDELKLKGPNPKFPYKANQFNEIGLIAGGAGVTPIWQLVQEISSHPEDKTKVTILYANKSKDDILLAEKWTEIEKDSRFKIVHFLDNAPSGWSGETGYISKEAIQKYLPSADLGEKVKVFVCGPPGQMKAISGPKKSMTDQGPLVGALADAGYSAEQVYKF